MRGILRLVAARARRRPGRWLGPALGIALACGFAGAVAAEGTIAGDQAARSSLSALAPLDRTVAVTWQGVVTPAVRRQATALLSGLGLSAASQTEVVLLAPVRLDGVLVRPAAISPFGRWVSAAAPGPCRPSACPMLLAAGASEPRQTLRTFGVRIPVVGRGVLGSDVPLGFTPAGTDPSESGVLLLSGDIEGLERLPGLSGVYRTHSWLSLLPTAELQSWQLSPLERRLQRAQAGLLARGSQFSLSAPFTGLDSARAQASAAPNRLLLAGGGALTAIALFVVLSAGGLRRDQRRELARLQMAGARASQCLMFVAVECAWLAALAVVIGAGVAVLAAALLASSAGVPVGGTLTHGLLTVPALAVLLGAIVCVAAVLALTVLLSGGRVADVLAVAAVAALALALAQGGADDDPLAVLLAPLACLAAGVLVFRGAGALLRGGERAARHGPVVTRLALVSLARDPAVPSLAIAFIAVSTGLGGFALAYRATLERGTADQAAAQVPLDATVSAAASFTTPLQLAPLSRWRALAGGTVLPVRRTEASFVSGGGTVTVPALGVPYSGFADIRGWRASDAPAPLPAMGRRLRPAGPVRTPGPTLPASTRSLAIRVSSPAMAVGVSADLRNRGGGIDEVTLGNALSGPTLLRARVPAGRWELEALELDEPAGLVATNGHQNAENPAGARTGTVTITLSPIRATSASGGTVLSAGVAGWRGVGGASIARPDAAGDAVVSFSTSDDSGLLRPLQPSDLHPVPVLVDPGTAAAAGRGGQLAMTVDEVPVLAHVVGVLERFPTVAPGAAGFVVADEATLAAALDAQQPGQGEADELWIDTSNRSRLRSALSAGSFSQLSGAWRSDVQHQLRAAPTARGVLGTLIAATALSGVLAVIGLLVALLGAARDRRVESDLVAQGVGPSGLRRELRARLLLAGLLGVIAGALIALLLTRLAVAVVRAAGAVSNPVPPLVTVTPLLALLAWTIAVLAVLAVVSLIASRSVVRGQVAR